MSNFNALNQIDTALQIGEGIYKISRVVIGITVCFAQMAYILVKYWVDTQVEGALEPVKEVKLLMPAKEIKTTVKALVQDVEDLNLEELQIVARIHKVKGWNFCKEETLRAKIAAM